MRAHSLDRSNHEMDCLRNDSVQPRGQKKRRRANDNIALLSSCLSSNTIGVDAIWGARHGNMPGCCASNSMVCLYFDESASGNGSLGKLGNRCGHGDTPAPLAIVNSRARLPNWRQS
ncbi:uncharacterized protein LOC144114586 [Amblyomma americanum]